MDPKDIKALADTLVMLKSQNLTLADVYKAIGLFSSIILGITFVWMRYLKNEFVRIVVENKEDSRAMIKDMFLNRCHASKNRISRLESEVKNLEDEIKIIRRREG